MHDAPPPCRPSFPNHQGGGLRVLRRVGNAVRSVVAAGIAITSHRRRPAVASADRAPQPASPDAARPDAPRRKPAPRRPRQPAPVPPSQPTRAGWLARWFGRTRQPAHRPALPDRPISPFSPEAFPGLSPEACAFFNTPVEDCDPDQLRLVLAAFVMQIADQLPPELGMDAEALFGTLCGRLGAAEDAPSADMPPAASEDAEPPPPPDANAEPAAPATTAPSIAEDSAPEIVCRSGNAFRR